MQMRTVYPKLAMFEAEIGRHTENYTCAEEGWKEKTGSLESKLNEVTIQKVDGRSVYSLFSEASLLFHFGFIE